MPCSTSWPARSAAPSSPRAASRLSSAFLSPDEWQAVWLTLYVSAWSVVFALPAAMATAFALVRGRFPGRSVLDAVAHLPLVLPPVVVGWLLLLVFGRNGAIGYYLSQWLGVRLVFTRSGAVLACAVMVFPLMLRAIRLSLEAIDPGLEQAACTLGAGWWDRFATVVLPLCAPGILVAAVVGFAASLGEFGAVITFAANIPGQTQTLPLAIYTALQTPGGETTAARLSLVSVVLAIAGLLLANALGGRLRTRLGR